jgi:hypothetical protein
MPVAQVPCRSPDWNKKWRSLVQGRFLIPEFAGRKNVFTYPISVGSTIVGSLILILPRVQNSCDELVRAAKYALC